MNHNNLFHAAQSTSNPCGRYEEISQCGGPCTNRTCANLNPRPNPQLTCPHICIRGECDCIAGYRRLESGECVPENKCPNWCDRAFEVKYECYNECSALECKIGECDCINGYLRNQCGVCVPMAQCSAGCTCKSDLEEIKCINSCSASTCEHVTSGVLRNCLSYCSKTCECKKDYARDAYGYCIPEVECCEYINYWVLTVDEVFVSKDRPMQRLTQMDDFNRFYFVSFTLMSTSHWQWEVI